MKFRLCTILAVTALIFTAALNYACSKEDNSDVIVPDNEHEILEGEIRTTVKLDASKTYLMRGYVRVFPGGILEIPAGTVIMGEKSSKAALIVEMGGKILANGTSSNPIVFTSNQNAGSKNIGDWSGVIICGKSIVNTADGTAQYEGGVLGKDVAKYGGGSNPDLNDSSGEFRYVRIEYAGIAIEQDKEINGLTLCGVGKGTKISHVQVSYGGDDAFEFFGGTVDASHLVAYRGVDDDFDFDQGYNGKIQYGISIKDPVVADAVGTSRGIELENKGAVVGNRYSRPVLSNFTFIGPGNGVNVKLQHGAGIHFGQNSQMVLANSIVVGSATSAVEFNTDFPAKELKEENSLFSNNIVFGHKANYSMKEVISFSAIADLETFVSNLGSTAVANVDAVGLTNTGLQSPSLVLKPGSIALTKAKFEGPDLSEGFDKVTFAGAMGTEDWTKGWVNWDPQNTDYRKK